jgi:hypothetical protein
MANCQIQQVTVAAVMQNGITAQKEPVGDSTGVKREDVLLEIHNT